MVKVVAKQLWVKTLIVSAIAVSFPVHAFEFTLGGEDGVKAVLNNTATLGAQWRMQERSGELVGKASLNPNICGRGADGRPLYNSCQGTFKDQTYSAERLAELPGQYSLNADNGNLNYEKHDLTQAPFKLTQDLSLIYKDVSFFARSIYFYDLVNNDFVENNPNQLNSANILRVGNVATAALNNGVARTDSRPCPADRNPGGAPCGIVYGAGAPTQFTRKNKEARRQIGQNFQLLDAVLATKLPLWGEKELSIKLGRQTINWGESTLLVVNSLNQAQPLNANNFTRVGFQVEEVFTPQTGVNLGIDLFEGASLEAFYQFQWEPLEIPTPGSFFSFVDLGTNNVGDFATASFGGAAEDPEGLGRLLDNVLSGLTDTTSRVQRLNDYEPKSWGLTNQFGVQFKYFAEWLNNGTEIGLYAMNYHSKLPYVSAYAAIDSCARSSRTTQQFLADCPSIPLLASTNDPDSVRKNPDGTQKTVNDYSAVTFDSTKLQFEYPENIKLFGVSFNTTVGDFSIQGEVAFRPDMPLQVDTEDLLFAAFGPTITRCHNPDISADRPDRAGACAGTGQGGLPVPGLPSLIGGLGTDSTGAVVPYGSSDYVVDANGTPGAFNDTFDLLVGHANGSARAFPSFLTAFRGGVVGDNPGSDITRPYDHNNPGYIRGYEKFDVYEFDFGATRVFGATENPFGADQILMLFELGATWVPDLPALNVLQLEAPGTFTHASAGADGSGSFYTDAASQQQACSSVVTCSYGKDGLRFNPRQEDLGAFPDKFSWGYRVIALIKYESILPGISVAPMFVWQHDMQGTAPEPAGNFLEGRQIATANLELRYKSALTINPGYTWFTGGGRYNLLADRDFAQIYVKYQF